MFRFQEDTIEPKVVQRAFDEKINQLLPNLSSPLLITNFDGQNGNYWMFTLQTDHAAPSFLLIFPSGKVYAFISTIETSLLSALGSKIEIITYSSSSKIIPLIKKIAGNHKPLLAEYSAKYSWIKELKGAFNLKSAQDVILPLRMVKTTSEIELLRKSVEATYEIFRIVGSEIKAGVTEMDIYNLIYFETRRKDAESSFKPIVVSGKRATSPHPVRATNKKLENGELLIVDVGVSFYGYSSDITRTFLVGGDIREHRFYNIAQQMFGELESMSLLKMRPSGLARKMKVISKRHRVDVYEKHGYGHGIGIAVHDICPSKCMFQDGMTFAFEPGFYTKRIGFRWENDYFIKDGRAVEFRNIK